MAKHYYSYPPVGISTSGLATEAKQDAEIAVLGSIDAKDFATSAKQDSAKAVLDTIAAKDFATAAKQDSAKAVLDSINGKDFSTSAKQDAAKAVLDTLAAKDYATSAKQDAQATLTGAVNETAPASDTASSGINGRLQRVAQRLTTLISTVATETTLSSLVAKFGSLGQKVMSGSAPVVIASDQSAIPASQSGTWNVNNVSGTVSLPTGAATSAKQDTAQTSLTNLETYTNRNPINATASFTQGTITSVGATATAPASTVGFIMFADSGNTDNIRFGGGITATTTAGIPLEPGRDTGFVPLGTDISICAVSGTQTYYIQWVRR